MEKRIVVTTFIPAESVGNLKRVCKAVDCACSSLVAHLGNNLGPQQQATLYSVLEAGGRVGLEVLRDHGDGHRIALVAKHAEGVHVLAVPRARAPGFRTALKACLGQLLYHIQCGLDADTLDELFLDMERGSWAGVQMLRDLRGHLYVALVMVDIRRRRRTVATVVNIGQQPTTRLLAAQ